ncbi:GntR family transcriptional regulator [Methylopila sp. Yamaguchi]|uniref:GntR family transcriptional regulator n=1 Tax=Methylopila sp. Yamaguchi TaxID=1437817 RepID=UPI000CB05D4B|nr:GntR family transcriptional regulator [Methylopila sp. Yamaguchi]GBD47924.1 GntR family transcriptional regulator [Methylopila sp. Yamaguchi]
MFERKRPAYALIADTLRETIASGRLPAGAVLAEGALASLFGASRSPVKQAFAQLEAEKLVRRFDGRGVLVGDGPPKRVALTAEILGLATGAARDDAWDTLYYALERAVIEASVFGRFRINELALARHFGVGRTVARNLLLRAQGTGIAVKTDSGHWQIVPMDEARISDLYELRLMLEPPLIKSAAGRVPGDLLREMATRHAAANRAAPDYGVAELDALEADIHVTCLGFGRNAEARAALERTRCLLVVGKHIQAAIAKAPRIDPFMDEHLAILAALEANDGDRAAAALSDHLLSSMRKAAERLEAFRAQGGPSAPAFLMA